MQTNERLKIVKNNAVEIVSEDELKKLIEEKEHPIVYCGYEPSGPIHIGHLVTITKLIEFQKADFHVKVLFADWHAWLNHKGDWEKIEKETNSWKKGFQAAGLNAEFVIGTTFQKNELYFEDILKMSRKLTINRTLRSMQQVARNKENATVSQMIYPLMQIEDIKKMDIDVATGGMEQRKIHMLAREILPEIGYKSPICIHTGLISSLVNKGKMSSSDPASMISIIDSDEEIKRKIKKAYCPEGIEKENPILEITKLIIFPQVSRLNITRKEEFGGNLTYEHYSDLKEDFISKKLHPMDLKAAVSSELTKIIGKIREAYKK